MFPRFFRLFLLILVACAGLAQQPKVEGPLPVRPGERCVICNTPLGEDDAAYLVDGQRVAVMRAMQEEFLQNPLQYVTNLRPQGMLVATPRSGFNGTFLWAGLFVLVGVMFGAACSHLAMTKGRRPALWFVLGFLFSVPACLYIASREQRIKAPEGLSKIPSTYPPAACPECGSPNHPSARACTNCGGELTPSVRSEVAAEGKPR